MSATANRMSGRSNAVANQQLTKGTEMPTVTLTGQGTFSFTADNLEPGTEVEASVEYKSDDGKSSWNNGFGVQKAQDDGTVTFAANIQTLTGGKQSAGTFTCWLRPAGTPQTTPPIDHEKLVVHIP